MDINTHTEPSKSLAKALRILSKELNAHWNEDGPSTYLSYTRIFRISNAQMKCERALAAYDTSQNGET